MYGLLNAARRLTAVLPDALLHAQGVTTDGEQQVDKRVINDIMVKVIFTN